MEFDLNFRALNHRPLCGSELAVGCEAGVIVWHVDPNSVITRPSASNTQLLTRPRHTHVSNLAWSPHVSRDLALNNKKLHY